jgi:hypothetical protein
VTRTVAPQPWGSRNGSRWPSAAAGLH